MESILMSIRPRHVANIFNGLKIRENRKRFPKDYRGWVYIYCTKGNHKLVKPKDYNKYLLFTKGALNSTKEKSLNGKVVARFYCDNVDMVYDYYLEEICALFCLTNDELLKYAGGTYDKLDDLYAIHITRLEIFDTPKELSEFRRKTDLGFGGYKIMPLLKAPQSWCYCEVYE